MQLGAQRAVVRVTHDRQVARHAQRELPTGLAIGFGRGACFGEHVVRNADQFGFVGDVALPTIGRVEQVVVEARREFREFLFHHLEARLVARWQFGAAQPEVAQVVRGSSPLCRIECRERWRRGEFTVTAKEAKILPNIGVKGGDLR